MATLRRQGASSRRHWNDLLGALALSLTAALVLALVFEERPAQCGGVLAPAPSVSEPEPAPALARQLSAPAPSLAEPPPTPLRPHVYLYYSSVYGLTNRLYSHINGLALAYALGVDGVLLPPALQRRTFNVTLDHLDDADLGMPRPVGTLLDVPHMMAAWWRRHGISLQEAPATVMSTRHPFGLSTDPTIVAPRPVLASARPKGEPADCRLFGLPLRELGTVADAVGMTRAVLDEARRAQQGGPSPATPGCVILQTETLFRAFMQDSSGGVLGIAAGNVAFAHNVERLAKRVAAHIGGPFNALHLRLERDMGLPEEELLPAFIQAMRHMGFNATTPLFVASGLLSSNDTAGFAHYSRDLSAAGVCSHVPVKEGALLNGQLAGLHSEQLALLDLLVLSRADKLVGTKRSAFSYFARELRLLRGRSRTTSLLHPPQQDAVVPEAALELLPRDESHLPAGVLAARSGVGEQLAGGTGS